MNICGCICDIEPVCGGRLKSIRSDPMRAALGLLFSEKLGPSWFSDTFLPPMVPVGPRFCGFALTKVLLSLLFSKDLGP